MSIYRVPDRRSVWLTFRIIAWSTVIFLAGIAVVAVYEPLGLGVSWRHTLAWIAGVIVLLSVVLACLLAMREGLRKLKEGFQFELCDGKIIQSHEGQQTIKIPLGQIESLQEVHGWLVISGGEPARKVAVPADVNNFEELKRELAMYQSVEKQPHRFGMTGFPLAALFLIAYLCLLTSHNTAVIMTAAGATLALLALLSYPVWRMHRHMRPPWPLVFIVILSWAATAWIVYQRTFGRG
jgi:MFS family permease